VLESGTIRIGTKHGFPIDLAQDGAALGASVAVLESQSQFSGYLSASCVPASDTDGFRPEGCVPGITIAAGAPGLDGGRGAVVLAIIIPMQYVSPTLAQ